MSRNCYAEKMSIRLKAMGLDKYRNGFSVTKHPESLDEPRKRKKPTKYFVCSMSDLFHEDVSFGFIRKVLRVIQDCPQHTFMVLTKRPERMAEFISSMALPNLWLGVTAEDQEQADKRIPILLRIPAAKRFVSCEPLLSDIKFQREWCLSKDDKDCMKRSWGKELNGLDWVIVGGESGAGARPMHPDWARDIRDQCVDADVPFFFKQWGEWVDLADINKYDILDIPQSIMRTLHHPFDDQRRMIRVGKKKAGRLLDDKIWDQQPE